MKIYTGRLVQNTFLITSDESDYSVAFYKKPDHIYPDTFLGHAPSGAGMYRVPPGKYRYDSYGIPSDRLALLVIHGITTNEIQELYDNTKV